MAALPPFDIEDLGRKHDGHNFGLRLIFEGATVSLPLRVTGTDLALHGPPPADDPMAWSAAACEWAEREFRSQYTRKLRNDQPVIDQVRAWELPLYLRFAE